MCVCVCVWGCVCGWIFLKQSVKSFFPFTNCCFSMKLIYIQLFLCFFQKNKHILNRVKWFLKTTTITESVFQVKILLWNSEVNWSFLDKFTTKLLFQSCMWLKKNLLDNYNIYFMLRPMGNYITHIFANFRNNEILSVFEKNNCSKLFQHLINKLY